MGIYEGQAPTSQCRATRGMPTAARHERVLRLRLTLKSFCLNVVVGILFVAVTLQFVEFLRINVAVASPLSFYNQGLVGEDDESSSTSRQPLVDPRIHQQQQLPEANGSVITWNEITKLNNNILKERSYGDKSTGMIPPHKNTSVVKQRDQVGSSKLSKKSNTSSSATQSDDWNAESNKATDASSPKQRKWPQFDDRVPKAILEGIRIHPDIIANKTHQFYMWKGERYEAPIPHLATVVTAYYDMPSKHDGDTYQSWFQLMLSATDPMVVFVDPTSKWLKFVLHRRQHAPTIVVPFPFRNLTMANTFHNDFWNKEVLPRDKTNRFRKGSDVYKIWNEKIIMVHEVALLNPFQTEHFIWIDAGYYRRPSQAPRNGPIVRNNITANGVKPKQLLLQKVVTKEKPAYEIAGGAWGGTASAIQEAYDRYFQTFWFMVKNSVDCVGFEQRVFLFMCTGYPSLCSIHASNYDRDWFAMGRKWLPSSHKDFSKPVQLNETAPSSLARPIPFPTQKVIHSATD